MASFRIEWKRSALKELERLPRQSTPKMLSSISKLMDTPYPQGVRKLVGSEFSFRIRVGDYRVIYDVEETRLVIQIVRVRHRKDAYR